MKLAIRRINLMSLGKVGCFLGLLLALLPSLLCGILGVAIAQVLRHWLEGWEELSISLLGQTIVSFDLVHTLGLAEFLNRLQAIGDASWLVVALVVLVLGLLTGLMMASITVLAGLAYNLLATATGGVVVDATAPSRREPAIRRED